ncbi:TauD/TfdA dioxygenase family protein [Nocardia sp. NPDC059764]|uniref:TauD/TfdA dioxygenase family protein n=1 Tax=Nocardia sp. NPDC059764 TaxID=3346939 RepID=UPI00365D615E
MFSHGIEEIARRAKCAPAEHDQFLNKLDDCGFAILEPGDQDLNLDEIMAELGEPVEYHYGTKLAIEPQDGTSNLQFSTRAMPLHTDALLNAGPPVNYIGMKCVTAPTIGGETLIASAAAFFEQAPADLIETMRGIVFEYRNRVGGYYKDRAEGDHPREAPIRIDPETGEERLVIGLSDPDDPMRTHDALVLGFEPEENAELLRRIDAALRLPGVLYAHPWRVGEVMVLDNRRVVHGRAAFPDQPRKLIRLSVA